MSVISEKRAKVIDEDPGYLAAETSVLDRIGDFQGAELLEEFEQISKRHSDALEVFINELAARAIRGYALLSAESRDVLPAKPH